MQALPHCRCWLSSNSCRQRPKSRGCSQLQGHPSRGEAVKDGTSQTVEENPQQEELLQQPAALADLDVEAEAKSAPEARTWGQQQMAVMQAPPIPLRQNPVTVQDTALAFLVMIALQLGFLAGRQQPQDLQSVLARRRARQMRDTEMWARQRQQQQLQAQQREREAARRMETARLRVEEAERRQAERERRAQMLVTGSDVTEEAQKESERLSKLRDAERRAFEEQEAAAQAELAARTEAERKVIEERREQQRQMLAEQRRQAEEARRQAERARLQKQREEEAAQQAELAARAAERAALRQQMQTFAVRVTAWVKLEAAPQGAQTAGRFPREARVTLTCHMGTLLGGQGKDATANFAEPEGARAEALGVLGEAAREGLAQHEQALRLQAMTGEGALTRMSATELQHWNHLAAARAITAAAAITQGLLSSFSVNRPASLEGETEVRTQRGTLPDDHPQCASALLDRAVACVEGGNRHGALDVLRPMMDEDAEALQEGLQDPLPPHFGAVLTFAHFLDHMYATRPAKQIEASPWYEDAIEIVRQELRQIYKAAQKDSLGPAGGLAAAVLGPRHPVAVLMGEMVEGNMSAGALRQRREQQKLAEAALAAKLLEEEWPDQAVTAAARLAEREAATPVPERVWALRNVASTLALGSMGEKARARRLLEQAVALKEQWVGSTEHPSLLPELEALGGVLEAVPDWAEDASTVRARMLRILSLVAARYRTCGEEASAVALLEASVKQYEESLGIRHRGIQTISQRAEQLFEVLPGDDRLKVGMCCMYSQEVRR
eukprot:jgi/Astpho2/7283/fgenesh1_pg.00113_%23_86_t